MERIPAGPDSPYVGWFRFVEYLPRAVRITTEVLPPLLGAARKAGLTVIHVASSESYTERFDEYRRVRDMAGPVGEAPPGAVDDPVRKQWGEERQRQMQGEHNIPHIQAGGKHLDFAPQVIPEPGEPIAINSHQLNAVCRDRGIWHLIYVGFAINWCLLASPGGMIDMSRLGYACSTIRQATTAVESRETCTEELAKEIGLWRTALMFGYVFDLVPFLAALNESAAG